MGSLSTNNAERDDGAPDLTNVSHELVVVVCNHGYTDDVMDVARSAGAGGGTVLHAKGTGGFAVLDEMPGRV